MEETDLVRRKPGIRRTRKQILKLLKEFQHAEGTSVADFCRMHKINKANFYNWQKRFSAALPIQNKPVGFIPLQPISAAGTPQLFAEINGIRLYQAVEPDYLKALLS